MNDRILFVRVGYMQYYNGSQLGDEKPKHGGSYNDEHTGFEIYNFRPVGDLVYGYAQPFQRNGIQSTFNLGRIDPKAAAEESIDDVLVIFVAKKESIGQVIIGWYRRAKVFRRP